MAKNSDYTVEQLSLNDGKTRPRFPSLPLVVPNDMSYNADTNELKHIPNATRDKLIVVPEAIDLLKAIQKPIGVLSIVGPYRSGKSYILSRLLKQSNAFALGHTMDAKTFGIWMGTSVLEFNDHVIILLDTEGIDACTASGTEDTRIFVLTLLLSSFFIYNSKGVVNKSDLDKMTFFVKLASSIVVKKGIKVKPDELRKYFPDFLWLLRDVTLQPTDEDGKQISATDYLLKRVLKDDGDFDESASDKVGRAIITFFPKIICRTLPPPSADTEVMRHIEDNEEELNSDFRKQVDDLVSFLSQSVSTNMIFNGGVPVVITGAVMARLTEEFVKEVSDPTNTPALSSTWDSTIKLLMQDVQERLVKEYEEEFTKLYEKDMSGGPIEEGDSSGELGEQTAPTTIIGIHHALMMDKNKKLMDEVGRFCLPTDESKESGFTQEQLLAQLKKKIVEIKKGTLKDHEGMHHERDVVIGGVLYKFVQENRKRSDKQCRKVFDDLYKPIKKKIDIPGASYNFEKLREDLQDLQEKYFLRAIGPAKWEVYDEKKKMIEKDQTVIRRLAGYEEKLLKADQEIAEAKRQRQQTIEDVNQLRQQLADKTAENQLNIAMIKKQHEEAMTKIEKEMKRMSKIEQEKHREFVETDRQRYAERIQANAEQQEIRNQKYMEMIQRQGEQQIQAMNRLAEKIQHPPPRPPAPEKKRRCCIQ